MIKLLEKLFFDFLCITASSVMSLIAEIFLKILFSLALKQALESKIVMILLSLLSLALFSLLLVFMKHYIKGYIWRNAEKSYYSENIIEDFLSLLKNGEYILVILLLIITTAYSFLNFDFLIIYSPIFGLNNVLNPKILASTASAVIVIIIYFSYLLFTRHSPFKK